MANDSGFDRSAADWKVAAVMNDKRGGNEDRALIRVIKFASAVGLGTMAAILYSVKQVTPALRYEVSFGTGVVFVLAVVISSAYWRLVFGRRNDPNEGLSRPRRRWLVALSLLLAAATVAPFVYALKDVAHDQAGEVAQGTAIAVMVLGVLGFIFWRVTRYLNADSQRSADDKRVSARPK